MEEKTLKELQAEAVKLGMSEKEVKSFKSKAPLIATLKLLKKAAPKEKVERVKTLNPPETPQEKKQVEKMWRSKAERMRSILDKQPKVTVMIPTEGKEKPGVLKKVIINGREEYQHVSGAIKTVTLNGYKTIVPKGVYFQVPKQVADVLAESQKQTMAAGSNILLDRIDPKTGRPVREALIGS